MLDPGPLSNPKPNLVPPPVNKDDFLKPKKTTRTMKPGNKSTMKHHNMLGNTPKGLWSSGMEVLPS